ncbi:MAG: NifU family protein [bacterium]
MKDQVEKALEKIRPMLQGDGGDVTLVDVDEKTGVVKISLRGACGCCPHAAVTLKQVVEKAIMESVPGVKQVLPV